MTYRPSRRYDGYQVASAVIEETGATSAAIQ